MLYGNGQYLNSYVNVSGLPPPPPSGSIGTIDSNGVNHSPCQILYGQTTCTSYLFWHTANAGRVDIYRSDTGQTYYDVGASGAWFPVPVTTAGNYFYLVVNGGSQYLWNVVGEGGYTYAYGLPPPPPTGTITAPYSPCQITYGKSTCTTSLTWNLSNGSDVRIYRSDTDSWYYVGTQGVYPQPHGLLSVPVTTA